jgi:hypothetical protein
MLMRPFKLHKQFASCQTAIEVRASRTELGANGGEEGISSWWNHAAPGNTQAMRAGNVVETEVFSIRRSGKPAPAVH